MREITISRLHEMNELDLLLLDNDPAVVVEIEDGLTLNLAVLMPYETWVRLQSEWSNLVAELAAVTKPFEDALKELTR